MRSGFLLAALTLITATSCTLGTPLSHKKPGTVGHPGEGEGEGAGGEGEGVAPDTLDPAQSTLGVAPLTSLPADGIAAFTLTAHLVSGAGHPMPGLTVTFTSDLGTLGNPSGASDANGDVTVTLASGTTGDASVTATIGTVNLAPITLSFEGCRTPAQAYEQELYPKVFSRCQGCHNELGLARQRGLFYQLPFPGVDNWAQRSVDVISVMAGTDEPIDDVGNTLPKIVAKPTMRSINGHDGGQVIVIDSEEDRLIQAFAARLNNPDQCQGTDDPAQAALDRVALLSPRDTYGRAKLALLGEVASPEELAAMPDTEAALDTQIDALMADPKFDDRLIDMYADWFLTDRFTKSMGGNRILNRNSEFTRRFFYANEGTGNQACDPTTDDCCREFFSDAYCSTKNDAVVNQLAREPLDIIADVVRNDRPISDAVTLDHTILTPLTATFYGFTDAERAAMFDADPSNDETETATGQIHKTAFNTLGSGGANVQYPHAGILTTQSMLARWPTTTSNKNRGRAQSIIMHRLMNIDVMKFAEFSTAELPADADLEKATQDYVACTACHAAIDPLAVMWKHYINNGNYKVTAPSFQTDDMPTAGFLDLPPPPGSDPLQFLAGQVTQHERFPLAMLMPVLQGLCGFSELDNNVDQADPDFEAKALAAAIQHKIMSDLRNQFAANGLLLKPIVKAVIKNEIFRAKSVDTSSLTDVEKEGLELAGIGRGVMITPEQLDRKLTSVFGLAYHTNRVPTASNILLDLNQYRILFGGIDYDAISTRFRDPSPVLARIVERMGNEMSCIGVPQDFATTDKTARHLFTLVESTDDGDTAVRAQIKRLHSLLLNETVNDGDAELEATVAVFNDALSQGRGLIASGDSAVTLRTDCRATKSFDAAATPYPTTGKVVVTNDPDYIIRAWMAVVSYLLADPRFFTE